MIARLALLALLLAPMPALSATYEVDLVRVIDGDTLEVDVRLWPGLTQRVAVRLAGVNTPEKRRGPPCERAAGEEATAFARRLVESGPLTLSDVHLGKFAGRVLGRIAVSGQDLGQALIDAGLARPYDGGKRRAWCG